MKTKNMTTPSIKNSISRPPLRRGLPRKQQFPRTQAMWIIRGFLLIPLALVCVPLAMQAQTCQQGCLGNENTVLGDDALLNNTTGSYNTANGGYALYSNTTGNSNIATGYGALFGNTGGGGNTAIGIDALYYNNGSTNTAVGLAALFFNGADNNTANGAYALYSNTTGSGNTATGGDALYGNTTGSNNSANGSEALLSNKTGSDNTANGVGALYNNTRGNNNTANGVDALFNNTTGFWNTANGDSALSNNTIGSNNIALGFNAGSSLTTGNKNIDIGNTGVAGEANTIRIGTKGTHRNTYIAGVSGVTVAGGVGVIIDTDGHLGTVVSSARFKDEIKPMDKASEAILALKPVTFRYKHELDPEGIPQFGLVAEQVEKVNPDLVARDDQGKPYTVRYEAVNAMLLNEFLKEHRKVESLEATVAKLQSAFKAQAAQIQKVSDQLEADRATQRLVANN
jgi:hypothetical protein